MRYFIDLYERLALLESYLLFELFNLENFVGKIKSVQELINRGATPGEKQAATNAMERLMARAKEEIGGLPVEQRARAERAVAAARLSAGNTTNARTGAASGGYKPQPPPPPPGGTGPPKFKIGDWVVGSSSTRGQIGKVTLVLTYGGPYMVTWSDGRTTRESARNLRRATQDEINKATKAPPKFKVGDWVALMIVGASNHPVGKIVGYRESFGFYILEFSDGTKNSYRETDLRKATQEEIDAATASKAKSSGAGTSGDASTNEWRIRHLAHFDNGDNSNKIYGVAHKAIDDKGHYRFITFWGGFTKAIATKSFDTGPEALAIFKTKLRKGYKEVDPSDNNYAYLKRLLKAIS